jgi:hypothetical protein
LGSGIDQRRLRLTEGVGRIIESAWHDRDRRMRPFWPNEAIGLCLMTRGIGHNVRSLLAYHI